MNNNSKPPSKRNLKIPAPAHPQERHEPLPWQRPKSVDEDPEALLRIKAILASPSYRQADHDVDFLNRDDTRGLRLQLDYLKPEFFLKQHGISQTIVVFGSTRILEPSAAQRKVDMLRQSLAKDPADKLLQSRLDIGERILAKSCYYEIAREFSRLVTSYRQNSGSSRIVEVTGG
ncbi:MAG: cytochrome D ubiquinol oxidase subunit II, partial [Nitrospirota bacterium]